MKQNFERMGLKGLLNELKGGNIKKQKDIKKII